MAQRGRAWKYMGTQVAENGVWRMVAWLSEDSVDAVDHAIGPRWKNS
jgi:hypothetical protein